jgi:O-antigen ligase
MDFALFAVLALTPLAAHVMAMTRPRRGWDTRSTPADAVRLATAIGIPAWVDPTLGILAALAVGWWAWFGWKRQPGGSLWLIVASIIAAGVAASAEVVDAFLALVLAVGVLQVAVGLLQCWNPGWLPPPLRPTAAHGIYGTLGHRNGLSAYLALLLPLGVLAGGWPLAAAYGVGLALTPSFVAATAVGLGLLVLAPSWWPLGLVAFVALWARRAISRDDTGRLIVRLRLRHMDTWKTRALIWRTGWRRVRRWPAWLIGYGAGTWALHARHWRTPGRKGLARQEVFNEAHNDWLEVWYEYGIIGLVAIGWWVWRMSSGFALGDPVTASSVTAGVLMLGFFPLRVTPVAVVVLLLAILLMRRSAGWAL